MSDILEDIYSKSQELIKPDADVAQATKFFDSLSSSEFDLLIEKFKFGEVTDMEYEAREAVVFMLEQLRKQKYG